MCPIATVAAALLSKLELQEHNGVGQQEAGEAEVHRQREIEQATRPQGAVCRPS